MSTLTLLSSSEGAVDNRSIGAPALTVCHFKGRRTQLLKKPIEA